MINWRLRSNVANHTNPKSKDTSNLKSNNAGGVRDVPNLNADFTLRKDVPTWNFDRMSPLDKAKDIRNWLQTIYLSAREDYLLDPDVQTIRMGLGWEQGADVDASVALFDDQLRNVDKVYYKHLKSNCGSIAHSGDDLTGVGDGDDEVISVKLDKVPFHVHHLLFAVNVFSFDVSFNQVRSAYVRMLHGKEKYRNHEMCRFSLTEMSGHAMLMGVLSRKGSYWNFRSLGTPATGRTIVELLQNPKNLSCFYEIPSFRPELRHVTVNVLMGRGLAAKDRSGIFRTTESSDPYYQIKFKEKKCTSEIRPQTLEPEWKSGPFDMGWITESECKPLKIEVYDYDRFSTDDFMGVLKIPGHALFNLGSGHHLYWFTLSDSKNPKHRDQLVSGDLLLDINIEESETQAFEI